MQAPQHRSEGVHRGHGMLTQMGLASKVEFRRAIFVAAYLGTLVGLPVGTAWEIAGSSLAGGLVIGAVAGAVAGVVIVLMAALVGWGCRTAGRAVREVGRGMRVVGHGMWMAVELVARDRRAAVLAGFMGFIVLLAVIVLSR